VDAALGDLFDQRLQVPIAAARRSVSAHFPLKNRTTSTRLLTSIQQWGC
jgi:hypothetical protein